MKRNYFIVAISIAIIFFASCEKEEDIYPHVAGTNSEAPADFKKEIIISDKTGENSIFVAITSSSKENLDDFISSNEFELNIITKKVIFSSNELKSEEIENKPTIDYENTVNVEVVKTNLKDPNLAYSLKVNDSNKNNLKNINSYSYSVTYTDYADYMTIVHRGHGYGIYIEGWYTNSWIGLWHKEFEGWIHNSGTYGYYAKIDKPGSYKTKLFVQRTQSHQYYDVFYQPNARGHACKIGNFDKNNYGECYLGTSPAGTSPFFWTSPQTGITGQYYSKLPGNNCPYPGSIFDGAHCFVRNIPAGCETYTWWRNWLIKSNYIY